MDKSYPLILVKHSSGRSVNFTLNPSSKLQDVRTILSLSKYMNMEDNFIFNNEVVAGTEEPNRILADILIGEKQVNIGVSTGTDPSVQPLGPDRFQSMNFNAKRDLLGERKVNAYTGLTFKEVDSKATFSQTFKKLYKFAADYVPTGINPENDVNSEEKIAFSQELNSMQCSGVNATTVSLSTPWVSAETRFGQSHTNDQSSETVTSYHTQRYLRNMVKVHVDTSQLIIENEFAVALKDAVNGLGFSKTACLRLVAVLNKYGWYIPTEYTLGGAIYSTKTKDVTTLQQVLNESESFKASFEAKILSVGAGAGHEQENTNSKTNTSTTSKETIILHQIGGACPTTTNDFSCWYSTLDNANNWRIIRFGDLYPSLMLLSGTDNDTLSACLQLLRTFCHYSEVKNQQKYINIQEYELKIASMIEIPYY